MLQIIFENHLYTAIFGWVLYVFFMFTLEKNKTDRKNQKFNYTKHWNQNWDNWGFAALLILVITQFAPEIWEWFNYATEEEMPFNNAVYLLVGPLAEGVHFAIAWVVIKAGIVLKALKTPNPEG